jgi:hypothetical protein
MTDLMTNAGVGPDPVPLSTRLITGYRSKQDCAADNLLRDATRAMLAIHDTIDDTEIDTRIDAKNKLLRIKAITIRSLAKIDALR